MCDPQIFEYAFAVPKTLGLIWLLSFGARIKKSVYDIKNNLLGCHRIGYGIHFMIFIPCLTLIPVWYMSFL
jgi:hypothetical protein